MTQLEALLVRQGDLIRATQYLEELDYLEGYFGGSGFTLLDHQMYHFQNALVLASGSLDILANILLACCSGELDSKDLPPGRDSSMRSRIFEGCSGPVHL